MVTRMASYLCTRIFKKTKEGNGQVVLISKVDEDPYCPQEV